MQEMKQLIERVRKAQEIFSTYSQQQVDEIFTAVAKEANNHRIPLAQLAVEETGMGVMEDKVIKNHYAAEYIYNAYKTEKTCGVIERNERDGYTKIAEPIGVIGAIIPTTNPTSTAIFKILICLKTRNGIILAPHPRAKKCTVETAKILLKAAIEAGAPEDIIGFIETPSLEKTDMLMKNVDLILATGGPQMVKAAYSSGKPAIGVGAGNTPAYLDETADIPMAVSSILHSKTFDNGVICASEQAVIIHQSIYDRDEIHSGSNFASAHTTSFHNGFVVAGATCGGNIDKGTECNRTHLFVCEDKFKSSNYTTFGILRSFLFF